jgi:hypothetical protein
VRVIQKIQEKIFGSDFHWLQNPKNFNTTVGCVPAISVLPWHTYRQAALMDPSFIRRDGSATLNLQNRFIMEAWYLQSHGIWNARRPTVGPKASKQIQTPLSIIGPRIFYNIIDYLLC